MKHTEWNDSAKQRQIELSNLYKTNKYKLEPEDKTELQELYRLQKNDDIKRFGQENIDWLTERLFFHDPIGLAPCECPKDEYETEARMILRNLPESRELNEVKEIVYKVFAKQFEVHCAGEITKPCYENIAKDMLERKI